MTATKTEETVNVSRQEIRDLIADVDALRGVIAVLSDAAERGEFPAVPTDSPVEDDLNVIVGEAVRVLLDVDTLDDDYYNASDWVDIEATSFAMQATLLEKFVNKRARSIHDRIEALRRRSDQIRESRTTSGSFWGAS